MEYMDVLVAYVKSTKSFINASLLGVEEYRVPFDLSDTQYNDNGIMKLDLCLKQTGKGEYTHNVETLYADTSLFSTRRNEGFVYDKFDADKVVIVSNEKNLTNLHMWYHANVLFDLADYSGIHINMHDTNNERYSDEFIENIKNFDSKSVSLTLYMGVDSNIFNIRDIVQTKQLDVLTLIITPSSINKDEDAVDYLSALFNDLNKLGFFDTKRNVIYIARKLIDLHMETYLEEEEKSQLNYEWITLLHKYLEYTGGKVMIC